MAPIHIGCLLFDYQVIDVFGPTDLLVCCSNANKRALKQSTTTTDEQLATAPEFKFHHIGITREPVFSASSGIALVPTTTVDECPELDCLLIGGPELDFKLHPKHVDLIRRHHAAGKLIFTTCTGAAVAASTGILDGMNATINHASLYSQRKVYPNVKWTKDKKWVVHGNVWTAGGAGAGIDMIANWIKENFGLDFLTRGAALLDLEPRDIDGFLDVIPKRYDSEGKQIFTHQFPDPENPAE